MRSWFFVWIPIICVGQEMVAPEEEALSLRRIADFWQEGEYVLAKNQIETYLNKYPDSAYYDTLSAALGDLCLREKNYGAALDYYSRIIDPEWQKTVFLSRMQCLYQLGWYTTLADECDEFLTKYPESESHLQATNYLAIGLYQQCLNAETDPATLQAIALRAEPYFMTLLQANRTSEVSQAFAYLCCVLKQFPRASDIYLELAQQEEAQKEQFLFQAAVLQSNFDKEKAIENFKKVFELNQNKAKEATFNYLVLHFEMGHYETITEEKEFILQKLDPSEQLNAHLLLGQSYFHLKKYSNAIEELSFFAESSLPYETRRTAIIYLLAASFKNNDLLSLERALGELDPKDTEYPSALFAEARLLKDKGYIEKAIQQLTYLLSMYSECKEKQSALFDLTYLEYQTQHWKSCRSHAQWFLAEYPSHELAASVWRYLISSSTQISQQEMLSQYNLKKQLISDLETALSYSNLFSQEELSNWQFLRAKTYYELHDHPKAFQIVEALLDLPAFEEQANAYLLMALLQKDISSALFCYYAEKALSLHANLVDPVQLHIALFNAYLENPLNSQDFLEQAASHLFIAFTSQGALQPENLDWLANYYYHQADKTSTAVYRAIALFEKCEKTAANIYKLAKLYSFTLQTKEQVTLLEEHKNLLDLETKLLLAEGYARLQKKDEAIELFDAIVAQSPTIRSLSAASASLQGLRLKQQKGVISSDEAANCLKNLILQRRLDHEPIHLEAALEYISLQSKEDLGKKLVLLKKTKADFESTDNLLSKDYHAARQKLPEKDHIYQLYIRFFDAEICLCEYLLAENPDLRKELQIKARELFLKIQKDETGNSLLGERLHENLRLVQTIDALKDECNV